MRKRVHGRAPLLAASIAASAACFGCIGPSRPTAMPNPVMLPDYEPVSHGAYMESTRARPTPEQRKNLSQKEQKVETIAATAAALVGSLFSSSGNVLLGVEGSFEENDWVVESHEPPQTPRADGEPGETDEVDARGCPPDGVTLSLRIYASSCRGSSAAPR